MGIHYSLSTKYWLHAGFIAAFVFIGIISSSAQTTAPAKIWDKTFGGNNNEVLLSLKQTSDGGFILGGSSTSGINGDKSQGSRGERDYWVVKIDSSGNKTWDKTFGGNDFEGISSLQQTSDGGYILGGSSTSRISGDKTSPGKGDWHFWVIKLDSAGNKLWDKTFGGNSDEVLSALQQTSDGGYILGGWSDSGIGGDKSEASKGFSDFWIVKLDASGNKIWDKTLGGSNDENIRSLQQTSDGGYILGGSSLSGISGDKSQICKGNMDYWVVKLDGSGNKIWDKTFGGNNIDQLESLQQTHDGGFILGGHSYSGINGDKTEASKGGNDYWVVKIDSIGNKLWDKTIGGASHDLLYSLEQTIDEGYILGGVSSSGISSDKSQASQGIKDYWVVKMDPNGNKVWDKTLGGNNDDEFRSLQQTSDGGFILGGFTRSGLNGDKTQISRGNIDYWVVKLDHVCVAPPLASSANNMCSGSTSLYASGAPTAGTYSWFSVPTGGVPLHTDSSGTFVTPFLNATTTFYVAAIDSAGCESPRTPVTVNINLTVTTGPAQTICETATPLQFTGFSPAGGTWSGPGVSASGLFTPVSSLIGNQTLTYTINQNGCLDSATQVITVVAAPAVSAGMNDTICASAAPFQLSGFSPAGGSWLGSGVNATGLFTPTHALAGSQTLTYSVTQNGCTVTSTKLVVIPTPPVQPIITLHSSDTLLASTPGNSYEWKFNNTVLPTTTQKLKATASGTYAVRVKDAASCASEFSADFTYTVSGRKEDLQNQFKLYPNPTSGLLTLELTAAQPAGVTVFNTLGQQILQKTVAKTDEKVQLDLSKVAKGIYLVQVQTEKQVVVKKIVLE